MKTAQDQVQQLEPFTSRLRGFDNSSAYEVSYLIHQQRIKQGLLSVGRKIGFTNPEVQALYGVSEPIWGYVYDTTVHYLSGGCSKFHIGRFSEPRIEPEIVVHFCSTPPLSDNTDDILACIDWIAHGVEIVQCHYPNWKFQAADTIADSALHAMLLIAEPQNVKGLGAGVISDLQRLEISLSCDGSMRDQGRGSNVLGSPLVAVAHLISVIAKQGNALSIRGRRIGDNRYADSCASNSCRAELDYQHRGHCLARYKCILRRVKNIDECPNKAIRGILRKAHFSSQSLNTNHRLCSIVKSDVIEL